MSLALIWVLLKRYATNLHPPLSIATLPNEEVDVLKNLGVNFNCKLN